MKKEPVIRTHAVDEDGWNPHRVRELRRERMISIIMYAVLGSPILFFGASLYVIFVHRTHQYKMAVLDVVGLLVYAVLAVYKFVILR